MISIARSTPFNLDISWSANHQFRLIWKASLNQSRGPLMYSAHEIAHKSWSSRWSLPSRLHVTGELEKKSTKSAWKKRLIVHGDLHLAFMRYLLSILNIVHWHVCILRVNNIIGNGPDTNTEFSVGSKIIWLLQELEVCSENKWIFSLWFKPHEHSTRPLGDILNSDRT